MTYRRRKLMVDTCPFCGHDHYKRDLMIVDIDGTLCVHVEPCDNDGFLNAEPLHNRLRLIRHLHNHGHNIVLQTGRPESGRQATEQWLDTHDVPYDHLCMEKSGYVSIIDDMPVLTMMEQVAWNQDDEEIAIQNKILNRETVD